ERAEIEHRDLGLLLGNQRVLEDDLRVRRAALVEDDRLGVVAREAERPGALVGRRPADAEAAVGRRTRAAEEALEEEPVELETHRGEGERRIARGRKRLVLEGALGPVARRVARDRPAGLQ